MNPFNLIRWTFGKMSGEPKTPLTDGLLTGGEGSTSAVFHEPTPISDTGHKSNLSILTGSPTTSSAHQELPPVSPPLTNPINLTSKRASPSGVNPEASNAEKYPRLELPRPLFALLIGINRYKNHRQLNGAVKDVDNVAEFLMDCMAVPERRITKLLNGGAMKDAIINGIRSLSSNTEIAYGDAIFIYFAGHGARAIAPQGWETETADQKIETICPFEMVDDETKDSNASGIPDVVLNALISELADKKGDNITVIFDCCHSASGLRGKDGVTKRTVDNPPPVSADWPNVPGSAGPDFSTRVNLRSLECAVFLAACGRFEEAAENSQGGVFTQKLLETIRSMSSDQLRLLTYKDLIRLLVISDNQHPQCEGSNLNRYLFRAEMANQSFISGWREKEGTLVLDAGEAPGIDVGTEFDIYSKDSLSPDNPSRGRLVVREVSEYRSILRFVDGAPEFEVPDTFFAIQTCFPESKKIKVYCSDSERLNKALHLHERGFGGFATLVDTDKDADLVVSFTGCIEGKKCQECPGSEHQMINFNWADDNLISQPLNTRIGRPIPLSNPEKLSQIFRAAAWFRYYLYHRENDSNREHVKVALHLLGTEDVKIDEHWVRRRIPLEEIIVEDGTAKVQLKKSNSVGPFGLTISNFTFTNLMPQVFWFECRDLTIEPWYTNPCGAGKKRTIDAPLRACDNREQPGKFHIGYGEGHNKAWGFSYDGEGEAVGFFKAFFATFNANFDFLVQKSPFDDLDSRKGGVWEETELEWWATEQLRVVQLPP